MSRTALLLALVIGCCAPSATTAAPRRPAAQREVGREASCKSFVHGFYNWYARLLAADLSPSAAEIATKRRPGSFSREVRRGLAEDEALAKKHPGVIVGLDFDPFLNAQDVGEQYVVTKVSRTGSRYRATVHGKWNGQLSDRPDVIPELEYLGGRWVFVNFHYPGSAGEKSQNLLALLQKMRQDRTQ